MMLLWLYSKTLIHHSEMTGDKKEDKCSKTRVAVLCQKHNKMTKKWKLHIFHSGTYINKQIRNHSLGILYEVKRNTLCEDICLSIHPSSDSTLSDFMKFVHYTKLPRTRVSCKQMQSKAKFTDWH